MSHEDLKNHRLNWAAAVPILDPAETASAAGTFESVGRSQFLSSQTPDRKVPRATKKAPKKEGAEKKAPRKTSKPKASASEKGASKKPASKKPTSKKPTSKEKAPAVLSRSSAMLALVMKSLDEDKAEDIVSIDLAGKTPIADYMVVASGRSQRHVSALAEHLVRRLKEEGFGAGRVEGLRQGDWVLIDNGDILIHVFRPEVREFYKLEKMWSADIPADQTADLIAV